MKYFLILLGVAFAQAHAQDQCASIWVYKPYKTCMLPANGPDTAQPPQAEVVLRQWSNWVGGGQDQRKICQRVRDQFNATHAGQGQRAELTKDTPVSEDTNSDFLKKIEYKYMCELSVKKYPLRNAAHPQCGPEDSWRYQIGGSAREIPGHVTCLSCEHVKDRGVTEVIECLRKNIEDVINTKAVELRPEDIRAVRAQIERLAKLRNLMPNVLTYDQATYFADFMDRTK